MDGIAKPIAKAVRDAVPPGQVKDWLSGTPIGHALHPLLTDLPIGSWTSALLLDALGGSDAEGASDLLIGVGLASTIPTVATGYADWADTSRQPARGASASSTPPRT